MEGIAALKTHYCEWLDGKDWDRWSALFTDDAVMQVGPDAASAVHGRSAIRRLLTRQLKQSKTKHVARNPEIDEEEPGRIRVVWEMTDRVETEPIGHLHGAFGEPGIVGDQGCIEIELRYKQRIQLLRFGSRHLPIIPG